MIARARRIVPMLALCALVACDLSSGAEDELPFRDEGGTGEEVAEADASAGASPSPSITLTPTPTPTPSPRPTVDPDESPAPGTGGGGGDGDDERERAAPQPRFGFPRPGPYTYSQQGYEEFCTSTCASGPLPARYSTHVSHGRSSRRSIVVIETTRHSDHRTVRTITRHTRSAALVSEVVPTFTYRGERHRGTYRPSPRIETLRLPLTTGRVWSGDWRGRTSGSYRMEVTGSDRIQAAGRSIRAVRVVMRMDFRGRHDGYSVVTTWVDPTRRVVIASVGSMEIRSAFGRYTTDFDTRLRDGPGYR